MILTPNPGAMVALHHGAWGAILVDIVAALMGP